MALTFSFLGAMERIAAIEVGERVPDGVNRLEVLRIRSQLRLVECPEHHRTPRAIHVAMTAAAPHASVEHDCGIDADHCQALDAEVRRLIALPHV